jgi:adenine-specific DNA-methyltransferase
MTYEQIYNLFKQRYNQTNWKQFLGQAFATSSLLATPETLTGIDSNVASQVQKLGYIALNENGIERQIAVYEVTLAKGIILERNRVGLRNLLRKYWKNIDAAFIVYHRPETPNWRFTYVSELTGYDADGEFIKIKTEPKRYTYVLGEGESIRTAAERFTAIANKGSKATLDDVKEAFSVEKLSKAFFDEYKKNYDIFCGFMVSNASIRQTIFNGDEKAIRDFNKKLLGRIVFLYFIQKKGWLGVPAKSDWGKGDFDFLTNLFKNSNNPNLFYSELLSKLFFETLNVDRKKNNDLIELVKGEPCRIPYLNGGLFEEDDKKHRNLILPANLFKNLFDFFNQYNFTIYEDDPNDHTVAVDPEMLGHIFENLLEDNKDKGAYYTPKEIVHYMCQESIIEYLCTTLKVEPEDQERIAVTNLLKKKEVDEILKPEIKNINTALDIVKICDPAIGSGAFPMGLLHEIFTAKQTLHTFEHGNTKTFDASAVKLNIIQNSIYGVDIEKGAVDIARLRFWLSLIVDEEKPKALPNLDYKIVVGNSLVSKLGDDIIDIDWNAKGSIGKADEYIKKLKTALSKLSQKQVEYFKAENKEQLKLDIRNLKLDILTNQISYNKERYANNNNTKTDLGFGLKPAEIKKNLEITLQLAGFEKSLTNLQKLKIKSDLPLQFFDWKLDFPEVMNENVIDKVGFDIVIGNPPYVGHKGGMKELFRNLKDTPLGKMFNNERMDIFYYFFHLSINLSNDKGIIGFITTNYFLTADSAIKLRKDLKERSRLIKLVNLNELKVFESAMGQHNIMTFLTKNFEMKNCNIINTNKKGFAGSELINSILETQDEDTLYYAQNSLSLFDGEKYYIRLQNSTAITHSSANILLEKIKKLKEMLGYYCNISQGIVTGIDKVGPKHILKQRDFMESRGEGIYVISPAEKSRIGNSKLIKPWFKNSDIKRYFVAEKPTKWLIHTSVEINLEDYPNIQEHLNNFKKLITGRNYDSGELSKAKRLKRWWALSSSRREFDFDAPKLVSPQRSYSNTFAYTEKSWYASADVYFISEKENGLSLKYILGILNSKLIYYWLYNRGKRKGEMLELYLTPISEIPIKKPNELESNKMESLVNNILTLKKNNLDVDTTKLENQIDNFVYKLYELTYDEVKVIDPEFSLTKKEYEAIKLE